MAKKKQAGIEDWSETKVVLAPSGDLLLALPIYANQSGAIFDQKDTENLVGLKKISIGVYEDLGYLLYHPNQDFMFYMKSLDLFEDLGKI